VTPGRPLRVLHTIGEMGTGGAESLVVELVEGGPSVGWHSEVASAGGRREADLLRVAGTRVHRVPLSRRRPDGLARAVAATRRAIRAADPDVVLAHNVGVTAATWLALRLLRHPAPLLTVFHGVAAGDYRTSARLLSRAPAAVVTVSGTIRDRLVAAGLGPRPPIVIPNAVTAPALPDRARSRRELGLATDTPVALCAARMVDQKRHDVLLRAWTSVRPPAVLLLAGDGPNRAAVEHLRDELGLGGRVKVLGNRSDMARLLAVADVCTLSSDWEGLPVALLEAMAAGRPVVSTAVDGVVEALGHGGGLLVPPGDPQALGQALDGLLFDPAATRQAGLRAAEVVAAHFDPRAMIRSYDQLLRSLVPQPVAGAPSPAATDDDETRAR
jgi:glycosyltransferase involved in cell wall biosynthesis